MTFFKDIENVIIGELLAAEKSVNIASAWFTNRKICKAIIELCNQGIPVDLIVTDDLTNNGSYSLKELMAVRRCSVMRMKKNDKGGMMHHKFCIIDGQKVLTGTYNYTQSANNNHEEITIKTGQDVNGYIDKFSELKAIYQAQFESDSEVKPAWFEFYSLVTDGIKQDLLDATDKQDLEAAKLVGIGFLDEIIKIETERDIAIGIEDANIVLSRLKANILMSFLETQMESLKTGRDADMMVILGKCKFLAECKQVFLKANKNDFISI